MAPTTGNNLLVEPGNSDLNKIVCVVVFVVLQLVISTGSYSGHAKPPMYGDFEAQRHWMEITINLPISDWYVNSTQNDLNYWGLDYPPLTAYHSWLLGKISQLFEPRWTRLFTSRGLEHPNHKLFMRLSVVATMLLFYLPAIRRIFRCERNMNSNEKTLRYLAALCYPGLLFVDNGHFQYNHMALGFFLWSLILFEDRRFVTGSILFVLALNFKQMELYHALPIFAFLLSNSIASMDSNSRNLALSIVNVAELGVVVLGTFAILWAPFLFSQTAGSVFLRLFPLYRGVYEDKVANFWCCFSVIFKVKTIFSNNFLATLSSTLVLILSLPSLIVLFLRPNIRNFRLSLVITALSFYLFSFQVHEKTILQVALPALLLLEEMPASVHWFLSISLFSLYPLCIKDEMPEILPLFVTYHFFLDLFVSKSDPSFDTNHWSFRLVKWLIFTMAVTICLIQLCFTPPLKYPHLFILLNALFSFVNFVGFFIYANFCFFQLNRLSSHRSVVSERKKRN